MPHTTMRRDAARTLVVAALALLVLISACSGGERPRLSTCGSADTPPIALDRAACDGHPATGRWYSGWADDLDEPDERPVTGEPLDEDWWDPIAQADLDDPGHRVSTPRATAPPRVTTAPKPTPAPRATATRAPRTTSSSR